MVEKLVMNGEEWDKVSKELENEKLKLAFYDNTVISLLGNIKGKKILDYGCGPGVLALTLNKLGANVQAFDISKEFIEQTANKIGKENTFLDINKVSKNSFDFIICNLVLCIVSEDEVTNIITNIKNCLKTDGSIFIGFCNPELLTVHETKLDLRPVPTHDYTEVHSYMKIKKEGLYRIVENHRPIYWYEELFKKNGLDLIKTYFTPEYMLKGNKIKDFIIFELKK